jgi:glycine/D-amino acid oxidase-like deaminating enzyme/nitrite reductase/ring-hydroxylating ferredoxin subunit
MSQYHQNTFSLWQTDIILSDMMPLKKSISTEVCVIGAGISGLMTAYFLQKKGYKVVVIDKDDLGFDETALSTAHLASALDDGFVQLIKWHGRDGARLAYQSHKEAIDIIEEVARIENIECDFKRVEGYLFLGPEQDKEFLERELTACQEIGIDEVALISQPEAAFFESGMCLRFTEQAQFHPLKFLNGLCERIRAHGGAIYTNTKVVSVHAGDLPIVEVEEGHRITCDSVVVATNVPINNMMDVHLKEAAYRTYAMALKVPLDSFVPALYWDTADPYHYIRMATSSLRDYDLLIIGGEDHRVGQKEHAENCFVRLLDWAQSRLGIRNPEVMASWSGQIIEPMDGLAYIGHNPGDKNVYIVTGDSGHGITHGAIASQIIPALIAEGTHRWAELYSPKRFVWRGFSEFVKENVQTGIQYRDWMTRETHDIAELAAGEGCVVSEGFAKVAAYRDKKGEVHRFSAVCPHLGGIVRWNEAEKSWDCPCHGSRFSKMGEVLNGPALNNLEPLHPEDHRPITAREKELGSRASSLR